MKKINILIPNLNLANIIFQIRMSNPEYFNDCIEKILVSHTFSYCLWFGLKQNLDINPYEDIEFNLNKLKDVGSSIVFNFENTKIEEKHLNDKYSNMLLNLAQPFNSYAIVYSEKLADYIKQKYPDITIISSAIRQKYNVEYPYDLVAINYDMYKNCEDKINDRTKIVLYTNSYCKNLYKCRDKLSSHILDFEIPLDNYCPNVLSSFNDIMKEASFISENDLTKESEKGVKYFIIRCSEKNNILEMINPYIYYLIKSEYRDVVRLEMIKSLASGMKK